MKASCGKKGYEINGKRGCWDLSVIDEEGWHKHKAQYEKKGWAILAGREFATQVSSGRKLENIPAIEVWKTIEPYCT